MKDNFIEILKLEEVKWSHKLEYMRDHFKMDKCMEMVHLDGMMENYIKANSREESFMVME